ncbi:MAG: hypothetical protein KDA28_06405 [Phycisphaerales bacterium]|nr:hypothetical protein [Phycisphaerales bacterium]
MRFLIPALLASVASAQPVVLTVDSNLSSLTVDATLDAGVASDSDSDQTAIVGTITVELDDYVGPTAITLHDFMVSAQSDLTLNFNFGFLGGVDAVITDGGANYGTPGTPTGPVAIAANAFGFAAVPAVLEGNGSATGSIFLIGDINESFNLSDFGLLEGPFDGMITTDGVTVTLTANLEVQGSGEPVTGVTMDVTGTAVIVATGDAPGCDANYDGDTVLDIFDITSFLADFSSNNAGADWNGDTIFDIFDVTSYLSDFSAGC